MTNRLIFIKKYIQMTHLIKFERIVLGLLMTISMVGCDKDITEFGFDGEISGKVLNIEGNIVPGDITTNDLVVKILGENNLSTIDIRVKGDGTFQHTKLFPQKSKIWIEGSVDMTNDTLKVDFSEDKRVQYDFKVVPFIIVKPPVLMENITYNEISVSYEIIESKGNVDRRQVYCSTNPYPNANTGSGPFYETKIVSLESNVGIVTISGLTPKTKYYIRIGARSNQSSRFNYSEQIMATTL